MNITRAPERLETERVVLRRPVAADVGVVFSRYGADPDVTRYVSWPMHRSLADTRAFLAVSDAEWERWPAGPYLIFARGNGTLLGGTGFAFETPHRAMTGYVLAKDAWGKGYATEAQKSHFRALLAPVDASSVFPDIQRGSEP